MDLEGHILLNEMSSDVFYVSHTFDDKNVFLIPYLLLGQFSLVFLLRFTFIGENEIVISVTQLI